MISFLFAKRVNNTDHPLPPEDECEVAMDTALPLDEEKAEAFSDRLIGVLNEGALALVLSIGHRTGLFDVLSENGSVTSARLADKAG